MTKSEVLKLAAAVFAGFMGSQISTMVTASAASDQIVRARRFELLDDSGRVAAYLGTEKGSGPRLRFLNQRRAEVMSVGVEGGLPYVNMLGPSSKVRLTLRLEGERAMPVLGMSDDKWEGRVSLGFIHQDVESESSDEWGLLFRAPQGNTAIATLAMFRDPSSGHISSSLALLDDKGELLVLPKRHAGTADHQQ